MGFGAAFHALVGAYVARERARTLLTVLGVALGVAVLVAIDLANESAVASFRNTLDGVAGRAQLTVRGNGGGLDPSVLRTLSQSPAVESASPLIVGEARFDSGDRAPVTLLVMGVDFLFTTESAKRPVRGVKFDAAPGLSFGHFLARNDTVVIGRAFAKNNKIEPGGSFEVVVGGERRRLRAGGVLSGGDFADAYGGNVVIVDLAVADEWLRRGGLLDRIDLVLAENSDPDAVAAELARVLPGDALVERPGMRSRRVDGMLGAFRFNLNALGHVSVLVGAFLIYNAISIAVVRRRSAIGTLRALGLRARTVGRVFLLEGLLLGLLGGACGVLLGIALARMLLAPVSDAISINFVEMRATAVHYSPLVLGTAFLLGCVGGLVASVAPAREAAGTPPANTMRRGNSAVDFMGDPVRVVLGIACAIGATVLSLVRQRQGLPVEGYAAGALAVGAFTLWSRPAFALALRVPHGVVQRAFGAEGLLALAGLRSSLRRAVPAVCGLLVSLSMCIAVVIMVSSFRTTVVRWMDQVLQADLFIGPATAEFTDAPSPIPIEFAERASLVPGVESVDYFRGRRIVLGDREAWLAAGRFDRARFRDLDSSGREPAAILASARENREVLVSEAFARKFGLSEGDSVTIPTPGGPRTHRIASVYFDYSTEQGFIVLDRSLYSEYFRDAFVDSVSVWLEPGADTAAVRQGLMELASSVPGTPGIAIRGNSELRDYAIGAFDRTFRVTYAIQAIAILVAVLGVATTLLAQIMDRRQETATLRSIGAPRRSISRIVLLEAGAIATVGIALGSGAGLALSWILTKVIMLQSFGWTIRFQIDVPAISQVALLVFVGTLVAGAIAAREAVRVGPDSSRTMVG